MEPPPYSGGYPVFPDTVQRSNYPNYMQENHASQVASSSPVINANQSGRTATDTREHHSIERRRSRSMPSSSNRSHRVNPNMTLQSGGIFTTPDEPSVYMNPIHYDPQLYPYPYEMFNENVNAQHHNIRARRTNETPHTHSGALDLTLPAEQQYLNNEMASQAYYQSLMNQQLRSQNRSNEDFPMAPTMNSMSSTQDSGRYSTISECVPDMNESVRNESNSHRRNDRRNSNHTLTDAEAQFYQMSAMYQGQVPEIPPINHPRNINYYYPTDVRHRSSSFVPPNIVAPSHQHHHVNAAAGSQLKYQYNPFGLNAATVLMDENLIPQSNSNPGHLRNSGNSHLNPSSSSTDQNMDDRSSAPNDQHKPSRATKKKSEKGRETTGKRTRHVFSHAQLLVLESTFGESKYCKVKERQGLAYMLGVTEKQVKVWFQNRRSRDNKKNANSNNKDVENGDGLQEPGETRKGQRGRKRKVVEPLASDVAESQCPHSRIHNSADPMINIPNKRIRSESETSSPEVVKVVQRAQRGRPKNSSNKRLQNYAIRNHFTSPNNENDVLNININNLNELNNFLPSLQVPILNTQNFIQNQANQQQRNLSIMINNQINNLQQQVFVPDYSTAVNRQTVKMPNQYGLCQNTVATGHGNAAQDVSSVFPHPSNTFLNNPSIPQMQGASTQNRHNLHQQEPSTSLNAISQENSIGLISLDKQHQLSNNVHNRISNNNSDTSLQNTIREESSTLQSLPSHNTSGMNNQYNQLEILSKFTETYHPSSKPDSSDKKTEKTFQDENSYKIQSDHRLRVPTVSSKRNVSTSTDIQNSDRVSGINSNDLNNITTATGTSNETLKNLTEISPDSEAVTIIHEVSGQSSAGPSEIILLSETHNVTDIDDKYRPNQKSRKAAEIKSNSMRENNIILDSENINEINMHITPTTEHIACENHNSNLRTLTSLQKITSTIDTNNNPSKTLLGKSSKSSTLHLTPRNSFRFNESDNDIEDSEQLPKWNSISNSNVDNLFTSNSDQSMTTNSSTATAASSSKTMFVQNSTSTTAKETSQGPCLIDSMLNYNGIQLSNSESQTNSKSFMDCYMSSNEILINSTDDSYDLITLPEARGTRNIPIRSIKVEDVAGQNEMLPETSRSLNAEAKKSDCGSKNVVVQNPFSSDEMSKQNNSIFNHTTRMPSKDCSSQLPSYLSLYETQAKAQNDSYFFSEDSDEINSQNQHIQELTDMSRSKAKMQYPGLDSFLRDVGNIEIKKEPIDYYAENDVSSMQNILGQPHMTQFNYGSTMEPFNSFSGIQASATGNLPESNKQVFQEQTNTNTSSSQIPSNSLNIINPFRVKFSTENNNFQSNTKPNRKSTSNTKLFNDFATPNQTEVSTSMQSTSSQETNGASALNPMQSTSSQETNGASALNPMQSTSPQETNGASALNPIESTAIQSTSSQETNGASVLNPMHSTSPQEINGASALNPFRCNYSNAQAGSSQTKLPQMDSQNFLQPKNTLPKVKSDLQPSTTQLNSGNSSHTQYYTGPSLPRHGYNHMVANKGSLCELKSTTTSTKKS